MQKQVLKIMAIKKWRTGDGRSIPLEDMEDDHLMKAFLSIKKRELMKFNKLMAVDAEYQLLVAVGVAVRQEAERRNIRVSYPDEVEQQLSEEKPLPNKYGGYFLNERKTFKVKELKD